MKNKMLISLILLMVIIGVTTGCSNKEDNNSIDYSNNDEGSESNETNKNNIAKDYTEIAIFGATVKFKQQAPTNYWNCEDDFGAGEIDTVFIPSENGIEVPNYYEQKNISGIIFQTSDDVLYSKTSIINTYKRWYGVNVEVEDIEGDLYKKHIKGESSKLYFEAYCFEYEGDFDGEKSNVYYNIELIIYKEDYTPEQIDKLIAEYKTIIDTVELN